MFPETKTTCLFPALLAALLLALVLSFETTAQETEGEGGGEETLAAPEGGGAPVVIEEEPYEYYYWPDENLNNFGLSSMGQGTTMGKTPERKSNLEVNPVKPKPAPAPGDEEEVPSDESIDADISTEPNAGRQTGASGAAFYKWVDDKGELHITNNIGEVPLEYQQQIYRQETPAEE
jgi:hypothetical protein